MFENLVEVLKANPRKIVYTEGTDARILESAARLKQGGFLTPILVGNVDDVKAAAKAGSFDIEGLEIIDPANYDKMDEMAQCMFDLRKGKMTMEEVRANLQKGNYFGTMLVKMGVADALLGGATYSTADTVRPALQLIKTKKGAHLVSSCFIMVRGDEMLAMGDCAINIDYQDTVDKATGEPVADASGMPVEAKAEFAPALSTGSQEVEISFDASLLGGRDLVVFESLRKDGAEVASHADLSDEGQTVHVAVEVGTQAADAADGDQVIEAGKAKVVDTVAYKGLVPGETYIAVGTLMDKGTGDPFLDKDGNEVRACDDKRVIDPALKESALLTGVFNRLARSCFYGVAVKEGDESPYRNGCIPAGAASAAVVEAAEQAALAFEQAMYKFETHRALAVCDDYLRAANKRWSDASKAANKLEGDEANAAMTQALVDAFTELRVATVLMHGIVPAGCELICEYFDVDPVAFFSWDNIFASTDEFVESLGEKPGDHRVKPLPPRFDFFSKHESQY